jgi:hypothetical protein
MYRWFWWGGQLACLASSLIMHVIFCDTILKRVLHVQLRSHSDIQQSSILSFTDLLMISMWKYCLLGTWPVTNSIAGIVYNRYCCKMSHKTQLVHRRRSSNAQGLASHIVRYRADEWPENGKRRWPSELIVIHVHFNLTTIYSQIVKEESRKWVKRTYSRTLSSFHQGMKRAMEYPVRS